MRMMEVSGYGYEAIVEKYSKIDTSDILTETKFMNKYGLLDNDIVDFDSFEERLALWGGFYKTMPHLFIKDYFGVTLKPFQKYLAFEFFRRPMVFLGATRGIGKSFILTLIVLAYCILFPNTKVIVVSGVLSQSYQIMMKIDEIRNLSKFNWYELEIDEKKRNDSMNTPKPNIVFNNGSYLKIATSGESARGHRATFIIVDESCLVDEDNYNAIIRRMASTPRYAPYLNMKEYEHLIERNHIAFLTSVRGTDNWNYVKYQTHLKSMRKYGKNSTYLLIALPYQVSVMNGLISKEQLEEEIEEDGFSIDNFNTELLTIWNKTIKDGYYDLEKLQNCRLITHPQYPKNLEEIINLNDFVSLNKSNEEIRIISADIALMGGSINDNTVLSYIRAIPNKNKDAYIRETLYMETISGGVPIDTHTIRIRELLYEFNCDYIVLDTNGIGLSIFNGLSKEMVDPKTNQVYPAYGCINDDAMQELVADKSADKIIYSIKASAELNKNMYADLQSKIIKRQLRLPVETKQADILFSKSKEYPEWISSKNAIYKKIMQPYTETDKLIDEMINLQLVDVEKIKLKEKSGKRKDRFSSIAMGNYFISTLEKNLFSSKVFDWSKYCATSTSSSYKRELY